MTEIYNFLDGERNDGSFFNHILLESDVSKAIDAAEKDGGKFDSSKIMIDLKMNGVTVRTEDFNIYMTEWYKRIKRELEDELKVHEARHAVEEKAVKMIKERCEKAHDILYNIEYHSDDSIYQLEEDEEGKY